MEGNNDANKTTRNASSRAVRTVARSTTSAFQQIEEFNIIKTHHKDRTTNGTAHITTYSHHHQRASITTGTPPTTTSSKPRTPTTAIEGGGDQGKTTIGITIQDNSPAKCESTDEGGKMM